MVVPMPTLALNPSIERIGLIICPAIVEVAKLKALTKLRMVLVAVVL